MNKSEYRSELKWVIGWALLIVFLASIPYIFGAAITSPGYHFVGFTRNIDDCAVYLSWMRQAADGHFFIRNLYTTDPQLGKQFNVFFLLMGNFARLTHMPLAVVFHIFRVLLGVGLIYSIWRFSQLFLKESAQRKFFIPLVGLSSGLGFLFQIPAIGAAVDTWQPEAITFLSIYLNPLFLIAQILMLASFYNLVRAQQTGKMKYGAYGGLALLILGNVHTYDVITVAVVWLAYVVCLAIVQRKIDWQLIKASLMAAVIALPSVLYQLYLYRMDPVFHARVETAILSPPVWAYFQGFGLVLFGAIAGAIAFIRCRKEPPFNAQLLLVVWNVVGFIVPYIPVGQQRKLIMGIHIPLCILCVYALSPMLKRLPGRTAGYLLVLLTLCTVGSNLSVMTKDISLLEKNETVTTFAPYISDAQLDSMLYLNKTATAKDVIYAPWMQSLLIPAYTGKQVYYGHWSETPSYADKFNAWYHFVKDSSPETQREVLTETGATYLIQDTAIPLVTPVDLAKSAYLQPVWNERSEAGSTVIYRVNRALLR